MSRVIDRGGVDDALHVVGPVCGRPGVPSQRRERDRAASGTRECLGDTSVARSGDLGHAARQRASNCESGDVVCGE